MGSRSVPRLRRTRASISLSNRKGSDHPNAICRENSDCSGDDVDCPKSSETGLATDIDPNIVATCCACKEMVEGGGFDGLPLPPACTCPSACQYGSSTEAPTTAKPKRRLLQTVSWAATGLDCSGCGDGTYTDTDFSSGFDVTSNIHVDYDSECSMWGYKAHSEE